MTLVFCSQSCAVVRRRLEGGLLHRWIQIFSCRTGWMCTCIEMLWSAICIMLCYSEVQFHWWWSEVAFHMVRGQIFIFLSDPVNISMYIEDVLLNYVVPYMPFVGTDSLCTQYIMRPHVAQSLVFLEEYPITIQFNNISITKHIIFVFVHFHSIVSHWHSTFGRYCILNCHVTDT